MPQMPGGFLWGAASSAYQVEGATRADGRGESIWDRFSATPGKVANGDSGEIACDHYHRHREDVALIRQLGLQAYRFSISWPRILPQGTGQVNTAGLDFYDRLVDELLLAGIRPFATLYHWDLPQALQDRWAGWIGRDTPAAFAEYADVVSRRLGDRVKDWITINEPWCAAWLGYIEGIHAPGLTDIASGMQAAHHLLLGHGRAVSVVRNNCSGARVGISLNLYPFYPDTASPADRDAVEYADGTQNRWFLDAIYRGRYPDDVVERLEDRAPRVYDGDMGEIRVPLDLLGVNYYTRTILKGGPNGRAGGGDEVRVEGVERTALGWEVYPQGLYEVLTRVHTEYAPAAIFVTENGAAFDDVVAADGTVHDSRRVDFLRAHFAQARRAIAAGVPLRGYFVWSLMDNFEWAEGYSKRFGLIYVDYRTQERIVKDSGHWYASVIADPDLNLVEE